MNWTAYALVLTTLVAGSNPVVAGGQRCLGDFEHKIERDFAGVSAMSLQDLETLSRAGDHILLLDVRHKSEFDVGHINGAIQVSPEISAAEFAARFADAARGKVVVLYCSVGVRSSRLAQRIGDVAREVGATGVHNLRGGVFRAHNANKLLRGVYGSSRYVHPYSFYWSGYLERPQYSRYSPAPASQ